MKTIVIGCDNAAVGLKNILVEHMRSQGITVEDMGCDSAEDKTYYPLIAKRVCERIIESSYTKEGCCMWHWNQYGHDGKQIQRNSGCRMPLFIPQKGQSSAIMEMSSAWEKGSSDRSWQRRFLTNG